MTLGAEILGQIMESLNYYRISNYYRSFIVYARVTKKAMRNMTKVVIGEGIRKQKVNLIIIINPDSHL